MNRVQKAKRQDLWWDWSWNPITGCKNGCWYCYAEPLARRFKQIHGQEWTVPKFHPGRLTDKDLRQPKNGQRVFVVSMGDIFSKGVKPAWLEQVLSAVRTRPQVNFIFLTKSPEFYLRHEWPNNAWLGMTMDTMQAAMQERRNMPWGLENIKWLNVAPALVRPEDVSIHEPDWLVSEPMHGAGEGKLVQTEANVRDWFAWALRHKVPCWVKGMKHWTIRCPIPHELPLHGGKCSV